MSPSRRIFISQILEGILSEQAEEPSQLDGLDGLGVNLKTSIANIRSLLSPIHRLPPELLTRIFTCICIPTWLAIEEAPEILELASVCGRWREIILSTPSLWANIGFDTIGWLDEAATGPKEFGTYLPRLVRAVRLFLARSETAPLNLSLGLVDLDETWSHNMMDLMDSVAEMKERWRDVDFDFSRCSLSQLDHPSFARLCRPPPLSLERLTLAPPICCLLLQISPDPQSLLQGFESCPLLTSLELNVPPLVQQWSRLSLPWRQITNLQISTIDTLSLVEMLRGTPELKELRITSVRITDDSEIESAPNPISLVMLEYLALEHSTDAPYTLRHFTFPRLLTLLLPSDKAENQWNHPHFTEFLERSSCTITHLRIGAFSGPGLDILQLFPRLKSLCIEETVISGVFMPSCSRIFTEAFLHQLFELVLMNHEPSSSSSLPYHTQLTDLTLIYFGTEFDIDHLVNAISTSSTLGSAPDPLQGQNLRLVIEYLNHTRRSEDGLMPSIELEALDSLRNVAPGFSLRVDVFQNRDY
ncbi:hypothetical protein PM082_018054 [Marasmius tenuissimus]|nr:hypothetical protein PM082_018054 [Marasmius tenuissimus]